MKPCGKNCQCIKCREERRKASRKRLKKTPTKLKKIVPKLFTADEIASSLYKFNLSNYGVLPSEAIETTMQMMEEMGAKKYTLSIDIND